MGRSGTESSAGTAFVGWRVIADPEQVRRVALSAASSPLRRSAAVPARTRREDRGGGGWRTGASGGRGELRRIGAPYSRRACIGRGKGRTWRRGRASRNILFIVLALYPFKKNYSNKIISSFTHHLSKNTIRRGPML